MSKISIPNTEYVILISILAVVLGVILWVLFAPLTLYLNSKHGKYGISFSGLVRARLLWLDEPVVRISGPGFRKDVYPLRKKTSPKAKPEKGQTRPQKKSKKRTSPEKVMKWIYRGKRVLDSFTVKRFVINFDTDDYILNAYLYPACVFLSKGKRQIAVNFQGAVDCDVLIRNTLANMIFAFFVKTPLFPNP